MKRTTLLALAAVCTVIFLEATLLVVQNRSEVGQQKQSRTAPKVSTDRGISNSGPTTVKAKPAPPAQTSEPRTKESSSVLRDLTETWLSSGIGGKNRGGIDAHQEHLQVWIAKESGFYYCAGSAYYKAVHPGALMTQGRALQSGYQPKLGQPCD